MGGASFLHSVRYSVKEGVPCVVSTDSEIIKGLCRRNNIPYFYEEVDDSNILNCVTQVLKKKKADKWILLQPTSPIRPPHLLKKLLSKNNENIMTVQKYISMVNWEAVLYIKLEGRNPLKSYINSTEVF